MTTQEPVTPAQMEQAREAMMIPMAAWRRYTRADQEQVTRRWLDMQKPRPVSTKQEIDELYE